MAIRGIYVCGNEMMGTREVGSGAWRLEVLKVGGKKLNEASWK